MSTQTLDASKQEQERLAAEKQAKADAAKAKADAAAQPQQDALAAFQKYQQEQAELQQQLAQAEKERAESEKKVQVGTRTEKQSLTRRQLGPIPSHQARYPDPDQVVLVRDVEVPLYQTQYDPAKDARVLELSTQLQTLQKQSEIKAQTDQYYRAEAQRAEREANLRAAEARLGNLQGDLTRLESLGSLTVAKGSQAQRDQVQSVNEQTEYQKQQIRKEITALQSYVSKQETQERFAFQRDSYEPSRKSDPRLAVGYNPITKTVEFRAGDIRGFVISTSKFEDAQRAGYYSGTPTLDPRVTDNFAVPAQQKEADLWGIKSRGLPPPILPQRDRPDIQSGQPDSKYTNPDFMRDAENYTRPPLYQDDTRKERPVTLTGQPDSKYTNPDFVSREKQDMLDGNQKSAKTDYFIRLDESPQLYTLDFGKGVKLEGLTEGDIALVQKNWESYIQRTRETAREQTLTSLNEIRSFVREAKEAGYKTISVSTTAGPKDIPINKDTTRILAKGEYEGAKITGAGLVPNIPEGYTVAGGLGNPILIQEQIKISPDDGKMFPRDPIGLSDYIYKEQQYSGTVGRYGPRQPDSLLSQLSLAGTQYYANLAAGAASGLNLVNTGMIYGAKLLKNPVAEVRFTLGLPKYYEPEPTGFERGFQAPIVGAIESVKKGNLTEFVPTTLQEFEKAKTTLSKTEIGAAVGQGAGFYVLSGAPNPTKLLKVVPLRYGALPMYTKQGETIAQKTLAFGYDTRNIPIVTKYGVYGQGKFKIGKIDPAKTGIREQEGISGSSFDRWQPPNLTPYQQTMYKRLQAYAEEQGITPKGFAEGVERTSVRQRDAMPSAGFEYEKQVPGKILPAVPEGKPTYDIVAGVGKVIREKLTEPAKGSLIYRMVKGGLSREVGDIDIEAKSMAKGEKAVASLLKTEVPEGYVLQRSGFNIEIGEAKTIVYADLTETGTGQLGKIPSRGFGIKEGTGTKIINIVTEKEQIKNIGGLDTSKVYGKSYPSKKIKYDIPGNKEKFASLSMEYQYQAKLASVGGVESRASLKGEGLSDAEIDRIMGGYQYIRGPKGRRFIKDVMDKYLGERETARVQFQKGDRAGALKSAEAMRATQEYYGKMFDFGKAFREYRLSVDETPQIKGESLLEKASGSVGRGASRTAPRGIPQGEPEQESISIRSGRPRSAMSARSAPTSISARTSATQPSIYSAKQASVRISSKSGSMRQSGTTKSPRMRSSSTKSLFSPSPKSALAPSPKSGFTPSPKSAGSPSIKSPPSPRITSAPSPMITSPPSPIIRPVPEILKPKPLPVPKAVPFVKQRTDKARELAEKERADFLGQAKVSDIVGFGKRGDITYGRALTARLASGDVRESGARYGRFSRTRSAKLLDRTKPALLKKDKKEKVFKL